MGRDIMGIPSPATITAVLMPITVGVLITFGTIAIIAIIATGNAATLLARAADQRPHLSLGPIRPRLRSIASDVGLLNAGLDLSPARVGAWLRNIPRAPCGIFPELP